MSTTPAFPVLAGKTGLVFGVANKRSIAWAIARAWAAAGAKLIFSYQGERIKANVEELTSELSADTPFYPCDVSNDADIAAFFQNARQHTDKVDLMLHSVAFAPKEALAQFDLDDAGYRDQRGPSLRAHRALARLR